MQPTAIDSKNKHPHGERVAFIQACWHKEIVDQSRKGFVAEMIALGYQESDIDFFEVGGAFECPCTPSCWPEPVVMPASSRPLWWWTAGSTATNSSLSRSSAA